MTKTEVTSKESIRKRKDRYRRRKNNPPRMENSMTVEEYCKKIEQNIANVVNKLVSEIKTDTIITDQQKLSLCNNSIGLLSALQKEIEKKTVPHLPDHSDNYPLYPGTHEDAIEWLKTHWGKYLKFFGAEENTLFQDQLWKLDERLMSTITKNSKYQRIIASMNLKVRDIIPTKTERVTKSINKINNGFLTEEIKAYWVTAKRNSTKMRSQKKPLDALNSG